MEWSIEDDIERSKIGIRHRDLKIIILLYDLYDITLDIISDEFVDMAWDICYPGLVCLSTESFKTWDNIF